MASVSLHEALASQLGKRILSVTPVRGGDIASAYRVKTPGEMFFAKTMEGESGLQQLRAEAEGLRALSRTGTIRVPEIACVFPLVTGGCLVLEFIESRPGTPGEYRAFGIQLAELHSEPQEHFGWPGDNFIGSLPQSNTPGPDWADFYATRRLAPQYERAVSSGLLAPSEIPKPAAVARWLRTSAGEVQPALLHGDLWGGNHLIDRAGRAVLIDPAVYAGHSEVDLAMSRLFGGYPPDFYQGYHSVLPPAEGESRRRAIYQLYYLLVHLNLFGSSYAGGVREIGRDLFGTGH
ncbi:fructosamine kinase family protein [Robiginitalea biformata]|uniref:Fructosamine kinase n=1 Tax=Robiginitalea biformata (strain ATCC BAA-864 / DSM 15991 / KCTC 12146 / HTCC2501) TaxID=313596 RepID=A4CI58_ROBBH|nr:fructosamine kinase family protein [Robiginitalea biformata]EAR16616.1 fructosamine kinase [Robiginitalea biformata HTCC2501]